MFQVQVDLFGGFGLAGAIWVLGFGIEGSRFLLCLWGLVIKARVEGSRLETLGLRSCLLPFCAPWSCVDLGCNYVRKSKDPPDT